MLAKGRSAKKRTQSMKKGDKVWITWENLDGPPGIGRGMALCEVVLVRKQKEEMPFNKKPYLQVRIRDPRGKLWWTPASSLTPYKPSPKGESNRSRRRRKPG